MKKKIKKKYIIFGTVLFLTIGLLTIGLTYGKYAADSVFPSDHHSAMAKVTSGR